MHDARMLRSYVLRSSYVASIAAGKTRKRRHSLSGGSGANRHSQTVKQRVGIVLPPMPPTSTGGTDTESNMTRPTILDKTKRQIIDAVSKNRLTIIIGPTG